MVCICPADMVDNYSQLCDAEAAGLLAVYDLLPYTDLLILRPDRDFVELKLRLQMFTYEMLLFRINFSLQLHNLKKSQDNLKQNIMQFVSSSNSIELIQACTVK